jgi:rhodanese-related sulfurtransferase
LPRRAGEDLSPTHRYALALFPAMVLMLCLPGVPAAAAEVLAGAVDATTLAARIAGRDPLPLILDVRAPAEYLEGTVPGAVHVGPDPMDVSAMTMADEAVLLASEPPEPSIIEAWKMHLAAAGITTSVLAGGLPAWRAAGFAVEIPEPRYAVPGETQFQIPRGLCEPLDPVQQFPPREDARPHSVAPGTEQQP